MRRGTTEFMRLLLNFLGPAQVYVHSCRPWTSTASGANQLREYRDRRTARRHQILCHGAEPGHTLLKCIVSQQPEAHAQGTRIGVGGIEALTRDESDAAANGTIIKLGNLCAFRQGQP